MYRIVKATKNPTGHTLLKRKTALNPNWQTRGRLKLVTKPKVIRPIHREPKKESSHSTSNVK
jgi:hypothetical protein